LGGGPVGNPTPVQTGAAPLPPDVGRYRITMTGFACSLQTADTPNDQDGAKDEVYAAASIVMWDRKQNQVLGRGFVKTVEYGATPNVAGFPGRLCAGSASANGGIWGGNGNDKVPRDYDPAGSTFPAAQSDRFPLLLWEGALRDGVEGVLIVPSLWESDLMDRAFQNYRGNWETSEPLPLIGSVAIQLQLASADIMSVVKPPDTARIVAGAIASVFSGGLVGDFSVAAGLLNSGADRPIGLQEGGNATLYQDRFVVVTREKLLSLAVGGAKLVNVPFVEPNDGHLNGIYTLYLRVERLQ
jgi:hypothetical protein